jgi:hypothetical protein
MKHVLNSVLAAIIVAAMHSLVMMPLFCIVELVNGARDWRMLEAAPLLWYFYWFPWQPLFLVAALSLHLSIWRLTFWSLPITSIVCALAGALMPGKNLAFFFAVTTEPLVFVGLGWWSLVAAIAVSPVAVRLSRKPHSEPTTLTSPPNGNA